VLEACVSFAAVFALLLFLQLPHIVAALGGVLAASTSPAVVMSVVRDLRAQGQVTERMLILTALNTAYAIVALAVIAAWWRAQGGAPVSVIVGQPLYLIVGSVALAGGIATLALGVLRLIGRNAGFQFMFLIGLVLTTVATVEALRLSLPLALLSMGVLSRALDRHRYFIALRLEEAGIFFVVILFSAFGASLSLAGSGAAWLTALLIVVARFVAKATAILSLSAPTALPTRKAGLLAIGLMPASGFMLFLLQDLADVYPQLRADSGTPVMLAAAILTLSGPLLAGLSITAAGEASERRSA
jgi:Kef-type K+ transport system membrane component KefB